MKLFTFSLLLALLSMPPGASAQLFDIGDIEVGYDSFPNATAINLGGVIGTTSDGIPYFTADIVELDPFSPGEYAADFPGFVTNRQAGLFVGDSDRFYISALDATEHSATGVGYVNYYNPAEDRLEASGRIAIKDNSIGTQDYVLNGASVESGQGDELQFIVESRSQNSELPGGDFHRHIEYDLLDDATTPHGAYGVMMQLESDYNAVDGQNVIKSDPFWIIWNHGMLDQDFDELAIPAFAEAPVSFAPGDFDQDGDVDLDDLDQFNGNLDSPATGALVSLDLDGDGTVGANDFQQHYEQLVETANGQKGTFAGDVNLDGTVNVLGDAFALVGNLNNPASSWAEGDLNADGTVNVLGDAFLLVGNLGNSNGSEGPSASAVPEPGSLSLLAVCTSCVFLRRRSLSGVLSI